MPRPKKFRRVCFTPEISEFRPFRNGEPLKVERISELVLTVDELETLRLIDKVGLSQEECSKYMDVGRTTVQAIYKEARRKVAVMLVDGRSLRIEGGDYRLCNGKNHRWQHACRSCIKYKIHNEEINRGGKIMKIAVPLEENKKSICVSFGRAPYFIFYDVEKKVKEILENPAATSQGGAGLKAAQFILDNGADTLITVRCGENAGEVFAAAELKVYKAQGNDIESNINIVSSGKGVYLDKFHSGFHGVEQGIQRVSPSLNNGAGMKHRMRRGDN